MAENIDLLFAKLIKNQGKISQTIQEAKNTNRFML